MKILMINVVCGIRSTGRICTDLASKLEALGHEVRIAYGRENVPDEYVKYAVRIGSDFDVKIHGIKARLFDGCGFGSKKATMRFIEWVKLYDPDVIHLHNIHGYYINIEVLFDYLRTCNKRIIWTLHDCWAFTGHSAYCDSVDCSKWINGCSCCPMVYKYPTSIIDMSKYNWRKKKKIMDNIPNLSIVTPSNWLARLVGKSFLSKYPVIIIHNGIDVSKFHYVSNEVRSKYGILDKKIVLGVSTSWDDMKGLSDFIRLSQLISDEYKIILVGLTSKQINRLPEKIIGIEKTNSVKELVELYSAADWFLNLSYCENYPTVNLEAVACGTQVLTYDTGGSSESAINGYVVPKGDLDAVVKTLKKSDTKQMSLEKEKFDSSNTTDRYIELYKSEGII